MSGTAVEEVVTGSEGDVLVLEVTANRPDLLSIIGVAREVAALTGKDCNIPAVDVPPEGDVGVSIRVEDESSCPLYTARLIRGVKVGPSPSWMQRLLMDAGIRPVNNVVDVTNFVLLETGHPLHAFDAAKLRGNQIRVRRAGKEERLVAIDGREYVLGEDDLVIADGERAVAIAGIMGGKETEVEEATVDVLLESAVFDPLRIRTTARRLSLSTESSYRFERGTWRENAVYASARAVDMILEIAGGKASDVMAACGRTGDGVRDVPLRWSKLAAVLGVEIDPDVAERILEKLGFACVRRTEEKGVFFVPPFRRDVYREVDLVEEVARIHGYEGIPAETSMRVRMPVVSERWRALGVFSRHLASLGMYETVTPSFVPGGWCFRLWCPDGEGALVSLVNPVRADRPYLRPSLVGSLLEVYRFNRDRKNAFEGFFERAAVHYHLGGGDTPVSRNVVSVVCRGDYYRAKGILETLFGGDRVLECVRDHVSPFDEETCAAVLVDGERQGWIGSLSRSFLDKMGLEDEEISAFEVDFDVVVEGFRRQASRPSVPRFPAVKRDYAFVVKEETEWATIEKIVRSRGGELVESVYPFDVFRGKGIPVGSKSVAFSVVFRAHDRTLSKEEVDEIQQRFVSALEESLEARLR